MDAHRQADRLNRRRLHPPAAGAAALLAAVLFAACARMEPPPGGPEDKTRPFVAGAYPAPGAVNVPRDLKVRIAFSEWVDKDVERGKVWLSPPPAKRLKVEARGEIIEISPDSPLDSGTTYVLGVSGVVKDLVGQPLEAPFQLVFSTGPTLDSGALAGRLAVFPGSRSPAGAFAALYPADPELRARFSHLAPRPGPPAVSPADSQPHPFREKPAYLASADSLGRFRLEGVRPGRYLLLGFEDINLDGGPNAITEPLAMGPEVRVASPDSGKAAPQSLALTNMDTLPNRLESARWVHESVVLGRSLGTVRLKFSRSPHPVKALRRELYSVHKAGLAGQGGNGKAGAAVPVMDICLNPEGELELYTAPLEPESSYVVACAAMPDLQGNPLDTARDQATFRAALADSAAAAAAAGAGAPGGGAPPPAAAPALPAPVFMGARRITGLRGKLARETVLPSRGLLAYYPRVLTDSLFAELRTRLEVKADTSPVAFAIARVSHHEFRLQPGPLPLRGQNLTVGYKPPPGAVPAPAPGGTGAPAPGTKPAPKTAPGTAPKTADASRVPGTGEPAAALPRVALQMADSAKLGSLQFRQDASAHGALLVLRSLDSEQEVSRITPGRDEFTVDSLPEGWYAVDYLKDADRDTLWNPGRARPWIPQETFVHFADSVQVRPGGVNPGSASGAKLAFPPDW